MSDVVLSCRGLKKTYQGPAPVQRVFDLVGLDGRIHIVETAPAD